MQHFSVFPIIFGFLLLVQRSEGCVRIGSTGDCGCAPQLPFLSKAALELYSPSLSSQYKNYNIVPVIYENSTCDGISFNCAKDQDSVILELRVKEKDVWTDIATESPDSDCFYYSASKCDKSSHQLSLPDYGEHRIACALKI